jgi:hypothetical protein
MPEIVPLNDTLFLDIVYSEDNVELRDELDKATEEFKKSAPLIMQHQIDAEQRRIGAGLSGRPQSQMGNVVALGPDVKGPVKKDDVIIFPLHAGSMVTVLDPEQKEYRRLFAISEKACLARYRED